MKSKMGSKKPKYREMLLKIFIIGICVFSKCCESVIDLTSTNLGAAPSSSSAPLSPPNRQLTPPSVAIPVFTPKFNSTTTLPPPPPSPSSSFSNGASVSTSETAMAASSQSSTGVVSSSPILPAVPIQVPQSQAMASDSTMPTTSVTATPSQPSVTTTTTTTTLPTNAAIAPNARPIRWCVRSIKEAEFCEQMLPYLQPVDYGFNWSCVVKASFNECIEAVSEQMAELVSLDPGWMYYAFYYKQMKLVLYEREPFDYLPNAVVVVTAELCNKKAKNKRHPDLQMSDLQGLRACLPGYRWAAGWNLPGKYLLDNKLVTPRNRDPSMRNDIELFNEFFDKSCMPSQVTDASMCSGCTDQCTVAAGQTGLYEGYPGAFRCLMEGKGDVAFLRDGIVRQYASTGNAWRTSYNATWATRPASDFRFLCPSGGCRNIGDGSTGCSLGVVRTRGIMVNNNVESDVERAITTALLIASKSNADFKRAVEEGNNVNEFLFSSSMQDISMWLNLTRQYVQPNDGSVDLATSWDQLEGLNNLTLSRSDAARNFCGVSLLSRILQLAMLVMPCVLAWALP